MPSRVAPDWRDPAGYRSLLAIDRPGFAWEFLRRNPDYCAETLRFPPLPHRDRARPLKLDAPARGAARWGFGFQETPNLDALSARAVWREEHDRGIVTVDAIAAEPGQRDSLDISQAGVDVLLLSTTDGPAQLLLSDGARHIHLALRNGSLLEGPVRLRYALEGLADLTPKLFTLRRLSALWRLGRMPVELFPRDRRAPRWIEMLRTLNAVRAGTSQREIARGLFGSELVEREWRQRSDYLRLRVQRLVHNGEAIAAGEYLGLVTSQATRP
jgi:hypothetical protein